MVFSLLVLPDLLRMMLIKKVVLDHDYVAKSCAKIFTCIDLQQLMKYIYYAHFINKETEA